MPFDDLVQRRLPWPSRTVDRCDLGRQIDQGDARFPFEKGRVTRERMFELNEIGYISTLPLSMDHQQWFKQSRPGPSDQSFVFHDHPIKRVGERF